MIDPLDKGTLRQARRHAEMTQADLAHASGTTTNTIWRIENGRQDPGVEMWARIVRVIQGKLGGGNG